MRRGLVVLVWLVAGVACAEPVAYRIDSARTHADFSVAQFGVLEARGRFGNVTGRVTLDGEGRRGSIDLDIPVSSVATGYDMRDDFVRGADMLDAARYPRIRFHSSALAFDGGRLVRVDGRLTLRDVTRPVSLTVSRIDCAHDTGGRCTAEAEGAIHRREFAMDRWWPLVGDEVVLRLRLVAVRE